MAQKAELLAAFAQTGEALDDFLASRSADERADAGGRKDNYSAKELVALTGFWMRYMVERMGFYARGEEPPREVDFDALNRDEIARQAGLTWDEVAQATRADLAALTAAVAQSSEALLRTPNYYGDYPPGPIEGEIMANGFTWAMQEIEKYYQRRGETARAADIHARLASVHGEPDTVVCDLMTPEQIESASPQPLILDVRSAKEYAAGHLPGARNLPMDKLKTLAARTDALPKDRQIVTYCNMHHPGQSRGERAAALLAEHGYTAAALAGGYSAWTERFAAETGLEQGITMADSDAPNDEPTKPHVTPSPLSAPAGYAFPKDAEGLLEWSHAERQLEQARNYWLATICSDGRPHVTPLWGVWMDGAVYFDGHPHTRWARNIAANPHVSVHLESGDDVVILDGLAEDVTTDEALGQRIIAAWMAKYGRLAPDPAGSGMCRLRPQVARGWSTSSLKDGARWRFG